MSEAGFPLSGAALKLHLVNTLAPTCGMETPRIARECYGFIAEDAPQDVHVAPPVWVGVDLARRGDLGCIIEQSFNSGKLGPEPTPEPEPEQVPVPATEGTDAASEDAAPVGVRERLLELCQQGLELDEINDAMGWKGSSASARISSYRFGKIYRVAREKRRVENAVSQPPATPVPDPRPEDQPGYFEHLERMCQQGLSATQIAAQLGCKHHVVASKIAKAALTNVWRQGQAQRDTGNGEKASVPSTPVKTAPVPVPVPPKKPAKVAPSPRAELAAHGVDGADLPQGVPVTKAGPKVWEHSGGPATIADVIAWLRHSGDTVIEAGKGMWLMNGEQAAARDLVERANRQRKRLRDPRFDLFELVKG
ncbi:MAG: hypothetical protein LDL39_06020 [Magnetospirillum sp.]|nr:hypothetical protein [Magnetospirillum sp.]